MGLSNKKERLFILLLAFVALNSLAYRSYYSNRHRNLNIILITVDALRPDHLGCYGYKRNTSPNIDRIAKAGVIFTDAIAQSSHTPPSMATILTATYPGTHGLIGWGYSIRPDIRTIPQILRPKGYKTIFIGANSVFHSALRGFPDGFDIFDDEGQNALKVTGKILGALKEYGDKPFFLWAHYMETHAPYLASAPYDKLFVEDELYDKERTLHILKGKAHPHYFYGYNGIFESIASHHGMIDNPDYYITQYDGAIRSVDEQIGVLYEELKRMKMDKNTIIILTSDHGEMLGEHGYYFDHGWFLYEELINVPLIIKCDRIIPSKRIINGQVGAHLDIMPTILDILGIRKPGTAEGTSLLPVILGKSGYPFPYIFADLGFDMKCIRTGEWKLTYTSRPRQTYELYNLKDDPRELSNLVFEEKEKFEFLKKELDGYKEIDYKNGRVRPLLDDESRRKIRSLGYLN